MIHSIQTQAQIIDMDQTGWYSEGDPFACRLRQPLADGYLEFVARAGYPLSLSLINGDKSSSGELKLYREPAPWQKDEKREFLNQGNINEDSPYLNAGSEQLLEGLTKGHWAYLKLTGKKATKTLKISNTGIYTPAREFHSCRNKLLPASYDQISFVRVHFSSGKTRPQPRFARPLQSIAFYVKTDKEIEKIEIDGHTDSAGDHLDNLRIAKERAEIISEYLQQLGIQAEMITVRHHAERYPITSNNTPEGRSKNRRVEIRLYKKDTPLDHRTFFSK